MHCSEICPSGALQDVKIDEVKIGQAELDRKRCHTWEGFIICRSCFERCPLKGKATILEKGIYPVITDKCAGCGICEHVCPTRAIETIPSRFIS
jgi:ferredoxin-type protein NapG